MSKENKRLKSKELFQSYEHIIELFIENKKGMTTKETYHAMIEFHQFQKSEKTIENYLKDIMRSVVPGVSLTWVNRGKHQLQDNRDVSPETLKKHLEKIESKDVMYAEEQIYMRLAMESIKELDTLSKKHHNDIEARLGLKNIESPYFIDNEDMESVNMSHADILDLKEAIRKDAIVEFKYDGKRRKDWYIVEPYKLIIFDGLWYLFGKDTNDTKTPYKTWRLIYIKDVDYARDGSIKHYMSDEHTESILKNVDDAKFIVDITQEIPTVKKNITVKLKIDAQIIMQFDNKVHIPGDVSEPVTQEDGSLIVTTKVNTIADVNAEIKSWFPYIEILEPLKFREDFLMEIEAYRDKFKDEIVRIKEKLNSGERK